MGQYVLEIGIESLEDLSNIIESHLPGDSTVSVLDCENRDTMTYRRADLPFPVVIEGLSRHSFASAVWRDGGGSGLRYLLINSPKFAGSDIDLWLCTIEYTTASWWTLWDELCGRHSVKFACVSEEEGLVLSKEQLTPESFPWSDKSLLVAAVRSIAGEWVVHTPNVKHSES